ncbi:MULTISPECIES: type II secretion system protein GspM [Thiomicrorhabdus]|uniref:Type II secretion system protein M n=1 Tax=Thiomicrorhabdus heinhorstiae TaxID=2748010 RepID=A0ABS0BX45_9GAMM|nr:MULTISPECIES: type II secretion system protein GspM [Thiomicrorhabdus]MBF6057969.1 type II secretion system protein M [Thiomicrorhabdus heinhorstiae]
MLPHLKQKWQELAARERALIVALAGFLLVMALYQWLWLPVQDARQEAQNQMDTAKQEWLWLVEKAPSVPGSAALRQTSVLPTDKTELMALLQKRLKQENLYDDLQQIQLSSKGVKVAFENVDAARLLRWLEGLEREAILPSKMSLSPLESEQPQEVVGKISAQIDFEVGQ